MGQCKKNAGKYFQAVWDVLSDIFYPASLKNRTGMSCFNLIDLKEHLLLKLLVVWLLLALQWTL